MSHARGVKTSFAEAPFGGIEDSSALAVGAC